MPFHKPPVPAAGVAFMVHLQDSPYLLMGDGVGDLDTALGVEDDDLAEAEYTTAAPVQTGTVGAGSSSAVRPDSGVAVEMTGVFKGKDYGAAANGPVGALSSSRGDPWGRSTGTDQGGGASPRISRLPVSNSARELAHPGTPAATGVGDVPLSLPAIRTSFQAPSGPSNSSQRQPAVATFSLGDEDELQEIKLRSPHKSPSKRD